jgi:penicillin-binding protein 1A
MSSGERKGARREPNFDAGPNSAPATRAGRRPRRKKTSRKAFRFRPGRLVYWGCVLALWGVIACIGAVFWVGAHLPAIQSLEIPKRPPSIKLLDVNQRVLVIRGDMGGVPLTLKELPPYLPNAFIAIEDRRFYSHFGVDPIGIARALVANMLRLGVSQGGSTLTQQLAKNLFLTQERTMQRKAQEAALAIWLERKFSKAQILELYLNRVYFGSGAWGIEQAAQRYFGKTAKYLSLSEAAMLAGLVKSPSRLAPTHNYEAAMKREQVVLAAMVDAGFESEGSMQLALAQRPKVVTTANSNSVNYVADWVLDALNDLIGNIEDDIVVQTTIDPTLQAGAEKSLTDELSAKGEKFGVSQGALVSMTPEGAVRALVGGRNYGESQFNRAVTAKRQPGSAFKPFVYLTALERGLTPETLREDKPVKIKGWSPENYTREYFGQVTLTKALAMSLNTVSVRLTQEFGPTAVVRTAHRLGIASKLEPNASIALGTSEVSVLELVSAYAPFANGGMATTPYVVERVTDVKGKPLYTRNPQSLGRIIEPGYVAMMNMMLQETLKTGTGHNAVIPGWPAGGKTGTSQDFRDAWFIGFTSKLVTGVWLGNDDGTPTKKVTGGGLPVDIWTRFMRPAHQGIPVAALPGKSNGTADGVDDWLIDRLFSRR